MIKWRISSVIKLTISLDFLKPMPKNDLDYFILVISQNWFFHFSEYILFLGENKMSNFSSDLGDKSNSTSFILPTLDELLDSLGFAQWFSVVTSFVLPSISFVGLMGCSLSAWIFFQRKFADPVFFYYRLLCLTNVLHLSLGIPYGLLLTPRYFPQVDTYYSSHFGLSYLYATILLFHFEDTLQMAI